VFKFIYTRLEAVTLRWRLSGVTRGSGSEHIGHQVRRQEHIVEHIFELLEGRLDVLFARCGRVAFACHVDEVLEEHGL